MSRILLITGLGGAADAEFLAPMLARRHEVTVVAAHEPVVSDTDTIIVGYGVGAVVAAQHAARTSVRALVLVAGWVEPTERRARWLARALDDGFARHTLIGPDSDRVPPAVDPAAVTVAASTHARDAGLITCPTLVIGAAHDTIAPIGQSRLLFGAIPGARWAEVPTGHSALVERPAEIVALVEEFVAVTVATG